MRLRATLCVLLAAGCAQSAGETDTCDGPDCTPPCDCPPGQACGNGACALAGTLCASNDPPDCPEGERCSEAGSCIADGWCTGDSDCPPAHACHRYFCEPTVTCGGGCEVGMSCSYTGGCVPSASCATDADCWMVHGGEVCNALNRCEPGLNCGNQVFPASLRPANNVLILLDRSESMAGSPLANAKAAIDTITQEFQSAMDLGLAIFNAGDSAAAVAVPVGPGTRPSIMGFLSTLVAAGGTPLAGALRVIQGDPSAAGLAEPDRQNSIVLITDGGGGSVDYNVVSALDDLRALEPPISTYVLGYEEIYSSGSTLHCYAVHGGVPRFDNCNDCIWWGGDSCHYPATNLDTLIDALRLIMGGEASSCSYDLAQAPPDPDRVYAYLDDGTDLTWVPRDHAHGEGFDLDTSGLIVTFYGAACEALRGGGVAPYLVFGCRKQG